jgi:tetratricopeptide (TPR) repeat protein
VKVRKKLLFFVFFSLLVFPVMAVAEEAPKWFTDLRDAIYAQILSPDGVRTLYDEALRGAELSLSGQSLYIMYAQCEYLMGRSYQDNERKKEAADHYDKGIFWAEKAQEMGQSSQGWMTLALNIAQACSVKSVFWAMANGLKVEQYSKKALEMDSRNVTARYMIAARYAFAPKPFGNYPRGITMMREILDANREIMGRDEFFNVLSAIGYAYLQEKKYQEARPWLEESLTYYPTNKFVQDLLSKQDPPK